MVPIGVGTRRQQAAILVLGRLGHFLSNIGALEVTLALWAVGRFGFPGVSKATDGISAVHFMSENIVDHSISIGDIFNLT